jgi:hypothetical protein
VTLKTKYKLVLAVLAAAAAFTVASLFIRSPPGYVKLNSFNLNVSDALVFGDGPVTVVEFLDLRCPFCAAVWLETGGAVKAMAEGGGLRLAVLTADAHGNYSSQAHSVLYCVYKSSPREALELLDRAYAALLQGGYDAQDAVLAEYSRRHNCTHAPPPDHGPLLARLARENPGVRPAVPTVIVVRGGEAYAVQGVRPEALLGLLRR